MRTLTSERRELIDALVAEADIGGITAALLEKDEHLSAALHAVFSLSFEHATLVFCGGTSLSKAHGLIARMSEDADIKVVLSSHTASWNKNQIRRYLGDDVRPRIVEALKAIGLIEEESLRRSLNDNRYIHSQWAYGRVYEGFGALRPHLQLELVARAPVMPTEQVTFGSLTDTLAGRSGVTSCVAVVSVTETLAEKVLSFLRRFALHRAGRMQQTWDTALVRHIYDVHCILLQRPHATESATAAFLALVNGDVQEYGYQDQEFAQNSKTVLAKALHQAQNDQQTRNEYENVLLPLVYGTEKPSFELAWKSFGTIANRMITAL